MGNAMLCQFFLDFIQKMTVIMFCHDLNFRSHREAIQTSDTQGGHLLHAFQS